MKLDSHRPGAQQSFFYIVCPRQSQEDHMSLFLMHFFLIILNTYSFFSWIGANDNNFLIIGVSMFESLRSNFFFGFGKFQISMEHNDKKSTNKQENILYFIVLRQQLIILTLFIFLILNKTFLFQTRIS